MFGRGGVVVCFLMFFANSHTSWGAFRFTRDRILAGGIISLRCVKRNCRGRLRDDEKDNVVSSSEHTHEPESGGLKVVSEIRRKSVEKQIIPQNFWAPAVSIECWWKLDEGKNPNIT